MATDSKVKSEKFDEYTHSTNYLKASTCVDTLEQRIFCGVGDGHIAGVDIEKKKEIYIYRGHSQYVSCLDLWGCFLFSSSLDRSILIWDIQHSKSVGRLMGHSSCVNAVQVVNGTVFSCGWDRTVKVWDLRAGGDCAQTFADHRDIVSDILCIDNMVISACQDKIIRVFDRRTNKCMKQFTGHSGGVMTLALSGGRLCSAGEDKVVRAWEFQTGKCVKMLSGHTKTIYRLFPALKEESDEPTLFSASQDGTVKQWSVEDQKCERTITTHESSVFSMCAIGGKLYTGGKDKAIWTHDLQVAPEFHSLYQHPKSADDTDPFFAPVLDDSADTSAVTNETQEEPEAVPTPPMSPPPPAPDSPKPPPVVTAAPDLDEGVTVSVVTSSTVQKTKQTVKLESRASIPRAASTPPRATKLPNPDSPNWSPADADLPEPVKRQTNFGSVPDVAKAPSTTHTCFANGICCRAPPKHQAYSPLELDLPPTTPRKKKSSSLTRSQSFTSGSRTPRGTSRPASREALAGIGGLDTMSLDTSRATGTLSSKSASKSTTSSTKKSSTGNTTPRGRTSTSTSTNGSTNGSTKPPKLVRRHTFTT
eukprot:GFYU01003465.1.p1 GENE.GFYU01003465.1~~GFYU01003465.1.p1  ORF type:complete len:589 (-),score=122.81 GFYU01003465.1:87-1853(-)